MIGAWREMTRDQSRDNSIDFFFDFQWFFETFFLLKNLIIWVGWEGGPSHIYNISRDI